MVSGDLEGYFIYSDLKVATKSSGSGDLEVLIVYSDPKVATKSLG